MFLILVFIIGAIVGAKYHTSINSIIVTVKGFFSIFKKKE